MDNKLPRCQKATLVLGAAIVTLLCRPFPMHAQSSTTQYGQPAPTQSQQQAQQPAQNQQPTTTTTTTTSQDQQTGQNQQTDQNQNRQPSQIADRQGSQSSDDITRGDLARFDQFLDSHREIAEQLRRTPSLIDDPQFLQSHPALSTYLQDHPSVKQEVSAQPGTFMRLERQYSRDASLRDRDADGQGQPGAQGQSQGQVRNVSGQEQDRNADGQNRDGDRRDVANFSQFLDSHREVAQQVRRDPSLLDDRMFVQNHPALQSYLQDHPGVRDQLRQNPNAFMRQEDAFNRDANMHDGDRDPMHDHMANFGGFLHDHSDIQRELSRDPSVVKDHDYMQNHAELEAYLNAHPDVRTDLMSNPQNFVQGARQYNSGTSSGSGMNTGRGMGTTGSGTTGSMTTASTSTTATSTSPKPATMPHQQ